MKKTLFILTLAITFIACKEQPKNASSEQAAQEMKSERSNINIDPIEHATMVLTWGDTTMYIDPVGGATAFEGKKAPDLILITDIHGDHLNVETLESIDTSGATIIVPQAVADKLPEPMIENVQILNNDEHSEQLGFDIEAIPMYNLREEALKFHEKGRGNGYVISKNGFRVYISGDTEDIPEMRNLENVDYAFVCMNLPYTMPVDAAISAVLEFKPKKVFPYHYRGTKGYADVARFISTVSFDGEIESELLDWYPDKPIQ